MGPNALLDAVVENTTGTAAQMDDTVLPLQIIALLTISSRLLKQKSSGKRKISFELLLKLFHCSFTFK